MKYAEHIGVEGFDPKVKVGELRGLVNGLIAEKLAKDEDDTEEDVFLTPDEVTALSRQELIEYADEIGVDFASDITDTELVTLINTFILEIVSDGDDNA